MIFASKIKSYKIMTSRPLFSLIIRSNVKQLQCSYFAKQWKPIATNVNSPLLKKKYSWYVCLWHEISIRTKKIIIILRILFFYLIFSFFVCFGFFFFKSFSSFLSFCFFFGSFLFFTYNIVKIYFTIFIYTLCTLFTFR